MSVPSETIDFTSLRVKNPAKLNTLIVPPSTVLSNLSTGSQTLRFFLPPGKCFVPSACRMVISISGQAPAAGYAYVVNPSLNNMILTRRLQINGQNLLDISNLNYGYDRAVKMPLMRNEDYRTQPRLGRLNAAAGSFGSVSPSDPYPGAYANSTATTVTSYADAVAENRYLAQEFDSANVVRLISHSDAPSLEYLVQNTAVAMTNCKFIDYWGEAKGTILALDQVMFAGSSSYYEVVLDSIDKQIGLIQPGATTLAAFSAAAVGSAVNANGAGLNGFTVSSCYLQMSIVEDDSDIRTYLNSNDVQVNIPWIDQSLVSIGAATSASFNVALPVAAKKVRAIQTALVQPNNDWYSCQNNYSNGSSTGLLSVRAWLNSVADTQNALTQADGSLPAYLARHFRGSALGSTAAIATRPVYCTNLAGGLPLCDMYASENVLSDYGIDVSTTLQYQMEVQQDAVVRSLIIYILSTRRAKLTPEGPVFVDSLMPA